MKKLFAIIALATLTLVACEKVEQIETPANNVTTIRAIAGAGMTKTSIKDFDVIWSAGDVLAVADEDDTIVKFTLDGDGGSDEGNFIGDLQGKGLGTYAVYPYTANATVSGNSVTVDYLASWNYGTTEFPMWGVKETESYSFSNVGGAVLVSYSNVPATTTAKTFVLYSTGDEAQDITGTVTVSGLVATPSVDITALSGKTVTINNVPGDATSVSFVVPVPAGSGYNFKAELLDGTTLVPGTNKTASNRTITLNKITRFPDVDLTPVINLDSTDPMEVASIADTHTFNYSIANVAATETVSAVADVEWISNFAITGTSVSFDVTQQPAGASSRSGIITLSYPGADDVEVSVKQDPAPVINVTSANPMYVVEAGGANSITYTIDNPTTATLSSITSDSWITITDDSAVSFTVASNTDAAPRTGTITLEYDGAEDVTVTVLQEGLIYTLDASTYADWTSANILTTTNPLHFGGQSTNAITCSISSSSDIADGKNISRVAVSSGATGHDGNITVTVNSLTITAHNTSASGEIIGNQSVTSGITNSTVTLTNSGATTGTSWTGKFYKIVYVVTNSKGNKPGWVEFNNAKFYGYNVLP